MSTKQTVEVITEMRKKGAQIHLTEEGWAVLVKMIAEIDSEVANDELVG
jgi:CTP-dependent riboflavin kinase